MTMNPKQDPICGDGAALAGYLYDECEPGERAAVSAHLAMCERCASTLAGLRNTRDTLAMWTPPEGVAGVRIEPEAPAVSRRNRSWMAPAWMAAPVWTQAAAAVLIFALGAGVAAVLNLDVRYDTAGVSVRTGWSERPGAAAPAGVDLAALDDRIRTIVRQTQSTASQPGTVAASAPVGAAPEEMLRKVEQMLAASEDRQQRELALRVTQVLRDVDSQHQADMARIERTVSPVAGVTNEEIQEQRQMLNYLMRVSQTK
jgi:hypothetical protein